MFNKQCASNVQWTANANTLSQRRRELAAAGSHGNVWRQNTGTRCLDLNSFSLFFFICSRVSTWRQNTRSTRTGWPEKLAPFSYALTSRNIYRFSKLVHCQKQKKICNNTINKNPTTPQVCRYTTLWNVRCLKSNNWNKTTSVTIHFKKLIKRNNVFIVTVTV